jgi:bifunctional DNA-binding transcriptional regulator/antitoxin component of YhaV-PrlF toxin-antitoxin module
MFEQKLVPVQENGQVTLPDETLRRLRVKSGDLVAIIDTPDGVLITPRSMLAIRALDQMGGAIRRAELSLDELIESGREERMDLIRERYGIESSDQQD